MTTTHIPVWTLGDRLRKAREDAGLSQAELAAAISVSRNTVGNAELGERVPLAITLRAWSEVTGVPLEWLRTGEVAPPPRARGGVRRGARSQAPVRSDSDTELMQKRYPGYLTNPGLPMKVPA